MWQNEILLDLVVLDRFVQETLLRAEKNWKQPYICGIECAASHASSYSAVITLVAISGNPSFNLLFMVLYGLPPPFFLRCSFYNSKIQCSKRYRSPFISLYIYKEGELVGWLVTVSRLITQLSVGQFGWNFGGWSGRSWVPLPPGGALISHQGVLL